MKPVGGSSIEWADGYGQGQAALQDSSIFDSLPGAGFDTDPVAAGIRPPAGEISGSGPLLLLDPAQNNAYRAINRAWRAGGRVRFSQPAAS